MQKKRVKIPKGLSKCPKCGEYRGLASDKRGPLKALCLCDGIPCPQCGKNKIHRPISEYYDSETGRVLHVPYSGFMMPCDECRRKKQDI